MVEYFNIDYLLEEKSQTYIQYIYIYILWIIVQMRYFLHRMYTIIIYCNIKIEM